MAVAWDVNGIREDIQLVSRLGSGGEGDVYITDTPGIVAKIYKLSKNPSEAKATENKYNKVRKLIEMRLQCEGICFPLKMVTSRDGRFIGYTMAQAKGDTLSDVIHPMVIKNEFPNMKRLQLVDICIDILEKVEYLHKHGIVMCDINLGNILVSGIESDNIKTSFVDTDSYQIGDLLGEVGVPIFTPPELHGVKLETVKRTYQNEYFSIATLLFMIMMPGQKPSMKGLAEPAAWPKTYVRAFSRTPRAASTAGNMLQTRCTAISGRISPTRTTSGRPFTRTETDSLLRKGYP